MFVLVLRFFFFFVCFVCFTGMPFIPMSWVYFAGLGIFTFHPSYVLFLFVSSLSVLICSLITWVCAGLLIIMCIGHFVFLSLDLYITAESPLCSFIGGLFLLVSECFCFVSFRFFRVGVVNIVLCYCF